MKPYVGVTSQTLEERFTEHWRAAKSGRDSAIYSAMRKYGIENFDIIPLDTSRDESAAFQKEKDWIQKLGTCYGWGYNMYEGGRGNSAQRERAPNARLQKEEAQEIKWLAQNTNLSQKTIASNYESIKDPANVSHIKRGKNWAGIQPKKPEKIPDGGKSRYYIKKKQAAQIKWLAENTNMSKTEIAKKLDTTRGRIRRITNGYTFEDVEPSKAFSSKGFKYLNHA